jgi:hypothetical protein
MTSKSARFAVVYAALRVAHDFGDHVLQTGPQAYGKADANRRTWVPAMAGHVGGYHAAQVAALAASDRLLGLGLRPSRVAAAVAISAGTHALLDRRWPVCWVLEHTGSDPAYASGLFTLREIRTAGARDVETAPRRVPISGPYLADQALHHVALWLAALVATSGRRC